MMATRWTKATKTKLRDLLTAEVAKGKGILAKGTQNPTTCLQTARKLSTFSEKLQQAQEKYIAEAYNEQNMNMIHTYTLSPDVLEQDNTSGGLSWNPPSPSRCS